MTTPGKCYQESEMDIPFYRDPDHLTHPGAKLLAAQIVAAMEHQRR